MFDLGSKWSFSGVLAVLINLYLRTTETRATLASYRANRMAMQLLGPCPNARKAYLQTEYPLSVWHSWHKSRCSELVDHLLEHILSN